VNERECGLCNRMKVLAMSGKGGGASEQGEWATPSPKCVSIDICRCA
jgi:hypothetical protein